MELIVPLINQESAEAKDCAIAGLNMILQYYGLSRFEDELKKIHIYPGIGTYMPQLGEFMIGCGFEAEIITSNPHLFTLSQNKLSQQKLLEYLENIKKNLKNENFAAPLNHFIEFMKKGGILTIKVPTKEDIETEISANRPLGACVTSSFLRFDKPVFNFHFNVITGIDEKFIYVNDPIPDFRGGRHKVPINDFMYSIYASAYGDIDNASVIKFRKKEI